MSGDSGAGEVEWVAPVTYLFPTSESAHGSDSEAGNDHTDEKLAPRRRIENISTAALARRGLSEAEVASRLVEKGFTEQQVLPEIDRLLSAGYLNDARLAEEIVRVESERKGKGRTAIVAELKRRGIDPADYSEAIAGFDTEAEYERAHDLAVRKVRTLRDADQQTAKRRLYGMLARRGYSGEVARAAVDEAIAQSAGQGS